MARKVDRSTKLIRGFMQPLLRNWLLQTVEGKRCFSFLIRTRSPSTRTC